MPAAPSTTPPQASPKREYKLTVNSYDRTSTLLIALLVMVGLTVFCLLVIFFANRTFPTIVPIPVVPVEATSANANQGFATEPDPPGAEDAPDLAEPQLQDTLDALTSAASISQALLSDETLEAEDIAGKGKGLGDARMAGPGGDGVVERVPRWERWKLRFEPESSGEFARWLDFHKIEIGVIGRDNLIHYAFEVSSGNPKQRAAEPTKETRGYTSAADGPMPALTNQLARKADIARHGSIVLLFYPFEVESLLWTIEQKHAEGRSANDIRETVFTVIRNGGIFSFEVIDQKYF
ncbi:MAG: hypothetical protein GXP28_02925 [Planctomycetes bacterium]|nr:hypothetical protein [Planctomycetota bacterium]